MSNITAVALAQDFASRNLSGRWLSQKQTDFLVSLARRNNSDVTYSYEKHTYYGGWSTPAGDAVNFTLYISPLNRCGLFNVSTYTVERARLEDEKRALGDAYTVINKQMLDRLHAQDTEGMKAILEDAENRRVMARYAEVEALLKAGV
jgi:hypothetical protein